MGIRGKRPVRKIVDKTPLLGNINDIVEKAQENGNYSGRAIDIEKILEEHEIKVIKEALPNAISGYLKRKNGKWVVGINKNHHPKRQRFTMAHEFAHFCLHKDEDEYFEDTTFFRAENKNSMEFTANEFAAELLMPEKIFKDAIREGITKVSDLAEAFMVSTLAVQYRAEALNISKKSGE